MKKPIEIKWPKHGVSDDQSHAKQIPNTTPHALNVRTLDPKSGRSQGAQRPGWADFTTKALHPGKAVDALASVSVDLPKIEYRGPGRSEIIKRWGHIVPGLRDALDLEVDREGNLFVLDALGLFEKIGADGEVETSQTFYVPQGQKVVPRIELDYAGNVYVATSHPQGYVGRVLRFERLEDGEDEEEIVAYNQTWEHSGFFGVRDFRVGAGILAVARFYADTSESPAPADVVVLGELSAPDPTILYVAATPWPLSTIALNNSGEVLCAAPANADRGQINGDEGWLEPVELWSPHELEDPQGYGAARRIHHWTSPETLSNTHVDGTKVTLVPDRRWLHSTLDFLTTEAISEDDGALSGGTGSYQPPTDLTARPAKSHNSQILIFPVTGAPELHEIATNPPVFRPKGAGLSPSIEFLGTTDNNLGVNYYHVDFGNKSDTDDDTIPNDDGLMTNCIGIVPHHKRAVYATVLLIRPQFSAEKSQVVFHAFTNDGTSIGLVTNCSDPYGTAISDVDESDISPGTMSLFVGSAGAATAGDETGTGPHKILSCDLTAADFDNPQGVALVVIQHAGSVAADGPSSTNGECQFRVNGRTIDRFTMLESSGSSGQSGIGRNLRLSELVSEDIYNAHNGLYYSGSTFFVRGSYRGHLLECITVLGSTTSATEPNEVPVSFAAHAVSGLPGDPSSAYQYTDMSAESYSGDPLGYTNAASEIERLEGWLAHKKGCPDILKGGTTPTVDPGTSGLQDMHPFGRDGSNVLQPPQGSSASGGVVLSPAGVALLSPKELLFKVGASGEVQWATSGGGHGLGVIASPNGIVFAVGRHDDVEGSTVVAKRVRDLGPTLLETGEKTWQLESADNIATKAVMGLAADEAGNLYWPREDDAYSVLVTFDADPADTEIFFTVAPNDSTIRSYIFQATLSVVGGATSVQLGATRAESAHNLIAAINLSGGEGVQYLANPDYVGPNPNWKAAYETTDGSDVLLRATRIGPDGLSRFSIPNTSSYSFTEIPDSSTVVSSTQIRVGSGINRRVEVRGGDNGDLLWTKAYTSSEVDLVPNAIALDPDLPLYPDDHELEGFPEFVYVAQRNNVLPDGSTSPTPTGDNVQRLRQVERVQVIGKDKSPRRTVHTATCGGDFFVIQKGKVGKLVNNGQDVFNAASPFAKLWTYRQKVYGLDGQKYIRFNPKTLLMEEWKADGAGKIPYGAKVACVFAGCIALGRTADDPHNFHLSERGNPDGWDTDPSVITPLSAFSGNSTGNLNFRKHDLVNCLIPARDDLLYVGGDQSITRLSSHPGTGGQLDNISISEGLAFGDCYAVGPGGTVFAKTTNGGILRIGVDGSMDRITLRSIERRLQDVNLHDYDIRMAWNFRHEGLHVVQVPKGTGERIVEHWFWDAKEDGWWPDQFVVTGLQPTAMCVFDSDEPGDRVVAIGCEDGFVRYESEDALNDGNHRINSEIVFGPLVPDGAGRARFSHLEVTLSSFCDSATVQVFTDDVADIIAGRDAQYTGTAGPGYRGYNMFQATGNQAWIKMGNTAESETFSLESLFLRAKVVGKRRRF